MPLASRAACIAACYIRIYVYTSRNPHKQYTSAYNTVDCVNTHGKGSYMTGTIINSLTILIAGLLGLSVGRFLPRPMTVTMQSAMGILIVAIGLGYTIKAENVALVGLSLVLGAVLGELCACEDRLNRWGAKLETRFHSSQDNFVKGFVTSTLVFCVGAMAILGSIENGLTGKYDILMIKSMLDGIMAMIFAASLGVGVLLSAASVFVYQGAISLGAGLLSAFFTEALLNDLNALGGVLIAAIGTNILGITRIKVASLLPGVFVIVIIVKLGIAVGLLT